MFLCVQFYQDTLESDESVKVEVKQEKSECNGDDSHDSSDQTANKIVIKEEDDSNEGVNGDGAADSQDRVESSAAGGGDSSPRSESGRPKGVLVIHSQLKKRSKKSVQWKPEDELEMHHFFELDETERGSPPAIFFLPHHQTLTLTFDSIFSYHQLSASTIIIMYDLIMFFFILQ